MLSQIQFSKFATKKLISLGLSLFLTTSIAEAAPLIYATDGASQPSDGRIFVVDINPSVQDIVSIIPLSGINPREVVFTPDGERAFVINSNDATFSVIDTATETEITRIATNGSNAKVARLNPAGTLLYILHFSSFGPTLTAWDIDTLEQVDSIDLPGSGQHEDMIFAPDGSRIYVTANGNPARVITFDIATNEDPEVIVIGTEGEEPIQLNELAITDNGSRLFVSSEDNQLHVIDTILLGRLGALQIGDDAEGMVISPDGNSLYVANTDSDFISVIDISTRDFVETAQIPVAGEPIDLLISEDGTTLYSLNNTAQSISEIDLATNTLVNDIVVIGQDTLNDMAFLPEPPDAIQIGGSISNVDTRRITCRNLFTLELFQTEEPLTEWDCIELGLIAPADTPVLVGAEGRIVSTEVDVTSTVVGVTPELIICRNLLTGQLIRSEVLDSSITEWNCTELGLTVNPGDIVFSGVEGRVN